MNTRNHNRVAQVALPVDVEVPTPVDDLLVAGGGANEGWQQVVHHRAGGRRRVDQNVSRGPAVRPFVSRRGLQAPVLVAAAVVEPVGVASGRLGGVRHGVTFRDAVVPAVLEVVEPRLVEALQTVIPRVPVRRGYRQRAVVDPVVTALAEIGAAVANAQPDLIHPQSARRLRRVTGHHEVPSDEDVDFGSGDLPDFPGPPVATAAAVVRRRKHKGAPGIKSRRRRVEHCVKGAVELLSSGDESPGSHFGAESPASVVNAGEDDLFPSLDRWLVDVSPFKNSFVKSAMFVATRVLEFGWILAIVSSSGEILTMYQHGGNWMSHVGVSIEFPELVRVPLAPLSGFLVLSELGVGQMVSKLNLCTDPAWPSPSSFIDFNAVLGVSGVSSGSSPAFPTPGRHFQSLFEQENFGPSVSLLKDVSSLGHASQSRFAESRPFRVLCGNDAARWKTLAGEFCSLEASSTLKNVLFLVPEPLKLLLVCGPVRLADFLSANFVTVKFALQFAAVPKKGEGIHLGFFLYAFESFRTVSFCKKALDRLIKLLGLIFSDVDFFRSVFERVSEVLSDVSERNMTSWDVAYVFNWINLKLFKLGHYLVQESSSFRSKSEIYNDLLSVLAFSFPEEQSLFLGSALGRQPLTKPLVALKNGVQFPSRSPQTTLALPFVPSHVQPLGGQSRFHASSSSSSVVHPPDKWCINHVAHCVGARAMPCAGPPSGGTCSWSHPSVPLPLSAQHKDALKNLAQSIKPSPFKSKFLSLIV